MRVIAGKYKGRTLVAPKGLDTRPTLDRTKETLFNILNFKLQGATVLDLFAGSGQLAIESLSRGAIRAVLCDNDRNAVAAIKSNFEKIGETPEVYFGSFTDCLRRVSLRFDVIFVDPPYQSGYYQAVLQDVVRYGLLADDGIVACEHSASDALPAVSGLCVYDCRKIGTTCYSFLKSEK